MTTYSVIRSNISKQSKIDRQSSFPLALGAVLGGGLGKQLLQGVCQRIGEEEKLGLIQALCLMIITIGTLIYTLCKGKIRTRRVQKKWICILLGVLLGILSVFLGIGGGPINIIFLCYFFSMETKEAAENSLYIIFFSQLSSLLLAMIGETVPKFQTSILLFMICGGILGGICGRIWNQRLSDKVVESLFCILMIEMIFTNLFNICKFGGLF